MQKLVNKTSVDKAKLLIYLIYYTAEPHFQMINNTNNLKYR